MIRWNTPSVMLAAALALGTNVAGCSEQQAGISTTRSVEKTFALTPQTAPVAVAFLRGELAGLEVVQRVDEKTGNVLEEPRLRGTLKLKNTASDRAVRLISGRISYADKKGQLIGLAENRSKPEFEFYTYQSDRLDPGREATRAIDVPFPKVALAKGILGDLRLHVTYIPIPYREESVALNISMTK